MIMLLLKIYSFLLLGAVGYALAFKSGKEGLPALFMLAPIVVYVALSS